MKEELRVQTDLRKAEGKSDGNRADDEVLVREDECHALWTGVY